MDSLESQKAADKSKPDVAQPENSPAANLPPSSDKQEHLPSDQAEGADAVKGQEKQPYQRRRKLYQAIARIEGSLKVKDDGLVVVTKGDKTEFQVVQIGGQNTAMRLLKRAANCRQGFYTLYPQEQAVRINNFTAERDVDHPDIPPINQMFVSGKLASKEDGAFFVDIGRNRRTHKAKKQIKMPLKIEGEAADPRWNVNQWIGLVLHRQGTKWIWQGDTRAVLKSGIPKVKEKSEVEQASSSSSASDKI